MPLLAADGLTVTLAGDAGEVRVLDGVSLFAEAGEIVDVTGASGAGKTTLLRALARLLPGATGTLALDGRDASEVPAREWRASVALLNQTPVMFPGTVAENLRAPWGFALRKEAGPPADRVLSVALASVGLGEIALDRDASRLSVGQAARVAMLRTVLTDPRVLLLDEPDANLDDASAEQVAFMARTFAARGGAVVRVRHVERGERGCRRYLLAGGALTEECT